MNDKEIKNILERINNFDKVDKVTEIDLTCAILRLENKKPKEIREILSKKELSDSKEEVRKRVEYFTENKDSFNRLMKKIRRNPISIFQRNKDFVIVFLKNAPSPIDVGLPFKNWDCELLKHYLSIAYKAKICDRTLRDALNSSKKYENNPLLSECRKNDLKKNFFLLYIPFFKISNEKKYSHFLPLLINCETHEHNDFHLYEYNVSNAYNMKKNNIYDVSIRHLPKGIDLDKVSFLVLRSDKREKFFKECFLQSKSIPKIPFIFCTMKDLKKISEVNTEYMNEFYEAFFPLYQKLTKVKDETSESVITQKFRNLLKKF